MAKLATLGEYIRRYQTARATIVADSWQQAVNEAVMLLHRAGAVESRYFDAIIDITAEYGPYYVVAPGIAMPHARPEDGVTETGFSLVTLDAPVAFGSNDNDPVDVILCLCAKSKEDLDEHVISEAMTLFESKQLMQALRTSRSDTELLHVLDTLNSMRDFKGEDP